MHTTPPTLLERLRQPGDREGWERFIQLYTPLLYYWARRAGVQDPADLVQDVFVVLLQELPAFQYNPDKSFRNWLRTILMNKVRKSLRRTLGEPLPAQDVAGPDPGDELEETEFRQRLVARALQLMQTDFEPATWKAFWECAINGRTAADVASELGLSVGAVWVNRSRVLARLRQELVGLMD